MDQKEADEFVDKFSKILKEYPLDKWKMFFADEAKIRNTSVKARWYAPRAVHQ
jgi:hypothetical protein